jgi:hypothetical protein
MLDLTKNGPVVTEHLFSIILEGYISTLRASQTQSEVSVDPATTSTTCVFKLYTEYFMVYVAQLIAQNNKSYRTQFIHPFFFKSTLLNVIHWQVSTAEWTRALTLATSAQDTLKQVDLTSVETWEEGGRRGLGLLESRWVQ